jgi:hypothetical protein
MADVVVLHVSLETQEEYVLPGLAAARPNLASSRPAKLRIPRDLHAGCSPQPPNPPHPNLRRCSFRPPAPEPCPPPAWASKAPGRNSTCPWLARRARSVLTAGGRGPRRLSEAPLMQPAGARQARRTASEPTQPRGTAPRRGHRPRLDAGIHTVRPPWYSHESTTRVRPAAAIHATPELSPGRALVSARSADSDDPVGPGTTPAGAPEPASRHHPSHPLSPPCLSLRAPKEATQPHRQSMALGAM